MSYSPHISDIASPVAIRDSEEHTGFGTAVVLALFTSLYLGSEFNLEAGVKITPTDLAILISLFLLPIKTFFKFRLNRSVFILLLLLFINSMIEMLYVIFVDDGMTENITLFVAILRNMALIYLISQLDFNVKKIQLYTVYIGAVNSMIALVGYFNALLKYNSIKAHASLWKPHLFYILDSGILRLQGLREDPNFFFLVNLVPVVFCAALIRKEKRIITIVCFILITSASVLTLSRTGLILLGILLMIILNKGAKSYAIMLPIFCAMTILAFCMTYIFDLPNIYELFIKRFESGYETGGSSRLFLWKVAIDGFADSVIFGRGGRYVLRTVGNYVHNDYLEMLSAHGLFGFCSMAALYGYVVAYTKKSYKHFCDNMLYINSIYIFFFLLIASMFFTIYYNPYIWYSVAFIFSPGVKSWQEYRSL